MFAKRLLEIKLTPPETPRTRNFRVVSPERRRLVRAGIAESAHRTSEGDVPHTTLQRLTALVLVGIEGGIKF